MVSEIYCGRSCPSYLVGGIHHGAWEESLMWFAFQQSN